MRADRLLAILMLLQARGRMTARQLADELEVSRRTIYRDVDALSAAGVPIYTDRGRTGGCALLESYRTTLTGLKEDELRALFMLSIPAPLAELGVSDELEAALRKLSASLPAARRVDEARVRERFLFLPDPVASDTASPVLAALHHAVWGDRRIELTRRLSFGAEVSGEVEPYALVASGRKWFLVARREGEMRVLPVSDIVAVLPTEARFVRVADFALDACWADWSATRERERPTYPALLKVAPDLQPYLPSLLREAGVGVLEEGAVADIDGWTKLTADFGTVWEARRWILAQGAAVEVLAPRALRETVADFATQAAGLYTARSP